MMTCCIASSFYIVGSITLTKIGFLIAIALLPIIKFYTPFQTFKIGKIDKYLALYFIASGLSLTYAYSVSAGIFHYIALINCIVLFILVRYILSSRAELIRAIYLGLVVSGCISAILGFLQVGTGHFFVPGIEARSTMTEGRFRANGLFDDPNYFGMMLTICWPLALIIWESQPIKKISIASMLIFAALLTLSRATMLIVILQIAIIAYIRSKNKIYYIIGIAVTAFLTVAVTLAFDPLGITQRLLSIAPLLTGSDGGLDNSAAERTDLFFAGIRMFSEYPWLGVGFGNFQELSAEFMSFFPRQVYAHNTFITVLSEQGIVGFFFYLAFIYAIGSQLLRNQEYLLFASLAGLCMSSFFLVAHYFPLTYLYFAAVAAQMSDNRNAQAFAH